MARKVAYFGASSAPYFAAIWAPDRILDALSPRLPARQRGDQLLLAATGGGNIGDQAMLETFLLSVPGSVTVICRSTDDVAIPLECEARVTVVPLPKLLSPVPFVRLPDMVRFRALARRASNFAVIGADLMDGLYNPGASIARASLLTSAARLGCGARALGFSWPERPSKYALRALRSAGRSAKLFARDPVSFDRLRRMGVQGVHLAADIVFAFSGVNAVKSVVPIVEASRAAGRRIAVVNVSALIESRLRQAREYETLLNALADRGFDVIVAPHVMRKSGNDLTAARSVLAGINAPFHLIEELMTPSESRWLAGKADVIITGRMHLAVFGLSQGVPTISLGTQGKVEGLYRHFQLPELAIEPQAGFGRVVVERLDQVCALHPHHAERIGEGRERISALARLNFR